MDKEKSQGQLLMDNLSYKSKNGWEKTTEEFKKSAFAFCEEYKKFLDISKTERKFAKNSEELLKNNGFVSVESLKRENKKPEPGSKVYSIIRKKVVVAAVIGNRTLIEGVNIIGAHIDSPRIDLKQNPLYEDAGLGLLKTHYYGGIKKYQWVTIPLAMHGVVVKENGEIVEITIGENDNDPVFTITDLLPHLAVDQMQKKMTEGITGEALNILAGSIPYNDESVKEKVKLNLLNLLNMKYGIKEEDLISAEIELVPAFRARDIGIDAGLIGAYGQDDRVCSFASLKAIIETDNPEKTSICLLTDREEVGSMGNTGAQSSILEDFLMEIASLGTSNCVNSVVRGCLNSSKMLSADVNGGVDPTYDDVQDKKNATYMGHGVILQKFTGSRGKSGASEASAEFMGELRTVFNKENIIWQTGELGKVDVGGGGTIAQYIANLGVEVIDSGVSLLSMHSPFEVASKIDIYSSFEAYRHFFKQIK